MSSFDSDIDHQANCPGHWVDMSTLASPNRQMCTACRQFRATPINDVEILDDEPTESIPEEIPVFGLPTWCIIGLMISNAVLIVFITYDIFTRQ
jgi:hypothetical protein